MQILGKFSDSNAYGVRWYFYGILTRKVSASVRAFSRLRT
jgi:hypothetical protein